MPHQRAFRQRKEGHIKKLESQVQDYQALHDNYKVLQGENYQLRDYIISLQSRLIESQGDFPPAPGNINLQQPQPGLPLGPPGRGGTGMDGTSDEGAPTGAAAAAAAAAAVAAVAAAAAATPTAGGSTSPGAQQPAPTATMGPTSAKAGVKGGRA